MINRRSLITDLISFVAAPAIVRASSLMPVKVVEAIVEYQNYGYDPIVNVFCQMSFNKGKWIHEWINQEDVYIDDDGRVTVK